MLLKLSVAFDDFLIDKLKKDEPRVQFIINKYKEMNYTSPPTKDKILTESKLFNYISHVTVT